MEINEQAEGPSELELLKRRADQLGVPYSNNIGLETLRTRINEKMGVEEEETEEVEEDEAEIEEVDEDELNEEEEVVQNTSNEPNGFEAAAEIAATKDTTTEQKLTQVTPPVDQTAQTATPVPLVPAAPTPIDIAEVLKQMGFTPEVLAKAVALQNGEQEDTKELGTSEPETKAPEPVRKTGKKTLRQHLIDEQMKLVRIRITCMDPKKKDLEGEVITVANKHIGTIKRFVPFGGATEEGWHVPYCIYKMLDRRQFVNIRVVKNRRTGYEEVKKDMAKEFAIEVLPPLTQAELSALATAQIAAGSLNAE